MEDFLRNITPVLRLVHECRSEKPTEGNRLWSKRSDTRLKKIADIVHIAFSLKNQMQDWK